MNTDDVLFAKTETRTIEIPANYNAVIVPEAKFKKMLAVIAAAGALKGDLDAHDESPTHFVSYHRLSDDLATLSEKT